MPAPASAGSSATPAAPPQSVDVAAIVDKAAAASGEKLEWRTSIVDLMKALGIDSSLTARKELANDPDGTLEFLRNTLLRVKDHERADPACAVGDDP